MKLKILSLVGVLSAIFIAAVIWRMNHFIQEDRASWAQAQMRTQISSLQQTTTALITDLQHRTSILQDAARGKAFWTAMDPFKAVAWVRDLNNPTLENTSIKDGAGLDDTNLASAVKDLQGKILTPGKFLLVPWKDTQNRNWLMVVWSWAENRKLVLWTGAEYLQALLETHKGSLAQLSFLSENGQVLAHSSPEYFATRVNDSFLYKDFKSSGASQGGGSFKDSSGEALQGYYEAISGTNLVVTAEASSHDLLMDKNKVWASFIFIGLGLVLLTLAGVSLLKWSEDRTPSIGRSPVIEALSRPAPFVTPARNLVSVENRQEAFKKIAASLGHELRSPLTRILGFSQLLIEKQNPGDASAAGYAESILRETRFARGTLEKLFIFAQEKEAVMSALKVEAPVRRLLQRLQPEIQKRNIQLVQKISDTTDISADAGLLEKALEAIFKNAMEAVERKGKKEIQISVQKTSAGSEIVIQDNGEGISRENIARVFDPFYTTRSFENHLGLGLSSAFGVVQQHGGEIKVESEKGQWTKISIQLPETNLNAPEPSSHVMASANQIPSAAESFSPADVEIEKLLDFDEGEETAPAVLRGSLQNNEKAASNDVNPAHQLLDDDRTVNVSLATMSEMKSYPGIIDKAPFMTQKPKSVLDDYKIEIRRPRGKVIENS